MESRWIAVASILLQFNYREVLIVKNIPAKHQLNRLSIRFGRGVGYACILALLSAAPMAAEASYGHIRTVEGHANLLSGGSEPAIEASANYPIQVADRVLVSSGGRMEVVLPDGNLLRIDENSELRFARLAQSADTNDDRNSLQLLQGQIQLSVESDPIDSAAFRVDTANSSLFLLSRGSYRVFTDGKSWTQVIVREGFVEVATEGGTTRVSAGQQGLIDGNRSPHVTVQAAPALDGLEQWAHRLEAEGNTIEAQVPYRRGILSPTLSYAAAPLQRHGRWMSYRGSNVWRPHVSIGWRPYHSGWWVYTPAGLTWVSTEPWGWAPYHYGDWGYAGGIGWVWYPGHRYTPGSVYWYWGPTHVGWIPTGHYSSYWDNPYCALPPFGYSGGFHGRTRHPDRPGVATPSRPHVQAGGNASQWRDWTFSSYERFGYRNSHHYLETGAELQNRGVFRTEVPKGVVTTETRDLTPNLWHQPGRVLATLERPISTRPRPTGLSRLGTAALSGTLASPPRAADRRTADTSRPSRLVRQWNPEIWQRDNRVRSQPVTPYRRDTRSSSSSMRASGDSPLSRRNWTRPQAPGLTGRSNTAGSRYSRPTAPGLGRSTIGGSRSPIATPGSGMGGGRATAPGRSSAGASGRGSGSSRSGRPMGGGASRSTSGDGGSG